MKQTRTLAIDGMSCNMCVRHVTRALNEVPGVATKQVAVGSAQIEFDSAAASEEDILQAMRQAGYPARIAE